MTSNATSFALTSLVCGAVACTSFALAQSRQTAPQSPSQLPPAQSGSEAAMPGELGREKTQALITPEEFERREGGRPLRMPAEQTEAAKDR